MNNEQAAAELSEFADSLQGAEGVTDAVCDAFDTAQVALRRTPERAHSAWSKAVETLDPGMENDLLSVLCGVAGYIDKHYDSIDGMDRETVIREACIENWSCDYDELDPDIRAILEEA